MKHFTKFAVSLLFLSSTVLSLFGCSSTSKEVLCPFTEITWESSLADIQSLEGELQNSYYSSYNGTTYVYNKEYLGLPGTVKYMFDDQEKLMSMAWLYFPESAEDLENVYANLVNQTTKMYGKSGFNSDMSTAKGEVWYLENGNIVIGVMSTELNEAIQYQFFHPDVSNEKPIND